MIITVEAKLITTSIIDHRSHTTGYSLLENYNNSVEKVLTLMTLYLKIVLNTDVFQHAILSSCWKFWRV